MIVVPGPLAPPAGRLLRALEREGVTLHTPDRLPAGEDAVTLAIADGEFVFDFAGLVRTIAPRPFRVLILSRLGAHPDARAASLQRLWRLEEHVRGGGAPTLTLRLAPIVAADAPLVRRLASRPSLPRAGRGLTNPVAEADVLETLRRALAESRAWGDWFEVAGPEVWSWAELREAAAALPPSRAPAAWEPSLDELVEHRLAEAGPWLERFLLTPTPIRQALARHAA